MFFQAVLEIKRPEPWRKPARLAGKPETAPSVLKSFPESTSNVVMETEKVPKGLQKEPLELEEKWKKQSEELQIVPERPTVPLTLPKEQKTVHEKPMEVPAAPPKTVTPRKVQEAPEQTPGFPETTEETQIHHTRDSEAPEPLRKRLEEPRPLDEAPLPVLRPETRQQKGSGLFQHLVT